MTTSSYNPDVLTCLANLSNDEVFTPPQVVNQMLDLLPASLWSDPTARFLDPVSKTGVFLREIAKRLMVGLADQFPDVQERANHIFSQQLYALAITELTALLSRRSVYCSKRANSDYSVCTTFTDEQGNIRYTPMRHTWENGRCRYCGASQEVYARGETLESHAYQFIHTTNPNQIFNMKFDVIIGNPPYQLSDGGGTGSSAVPIYQKFVTQAKKLNPQYLIMIIPSRWFTGGRGLDEFREEMLHDKNIRILHDFPDASFCFPGVEIKGGVCYFLREKDNQGLCKIYTHQNESIDFSERPLLEKGTDTFIRNNKAISILHKVQEHKEPSFASLISANDPFGFDLREQNSYKRIKPNYCIENFKDSVRFYYNGWRKEGLGYINMEQIRKNKDWVDKYKIFIPKAWGIGDPSTDYLRPIVAEKRSCCTETYLVVGPFDSAELTNHIVSYMQTKFFHLMVSLIKISQNSMKKVYSFVPLQDFSEPWTDEKLYKKYGLTEEEIAFIESMIRPME